MHFYGKKDNYSVLLLASDGMLRTIEFASRCCYNANDKTTPDSYKKYIEARIKSGHESVIEHGMMSAIVDLSNIHATDAYAAESFIQSILTASNSLLHYVSETGWNYHNLSGTILCISGNMKMWRDFIKYIYYNKVLYPQGVVREEKIGVLSFLIYSIVYSDMAQFDGLFTSDIKGIGNVSSIFNKYTYNSLEDNTISFEYSGKTTKDFPLVDLTKCDTVYQSKASTKVDEYGLSVDISEEPDVEYMKIINMDNMFFHLIGNRFVPDYMSVFVGGHTLDVNSVTMFIQMPRIVTQQESRHRINSISQRSQRYVDEGNASDTGFYVPDSIDPNKIYEFEINGKDNFTLTYSEVNQLLLSFYNALRKDGVNKEDARLILPGGINSKMIVTKPFHTLPHYFKERCSEAAQKEIRLPAIGLKNYLNERFSYLSKNRNTKLFK